MKLLACFALAVSVMVTACASGTEDSNGDNEPIVFSGKLRIAGTAMEATLLLDLDTTPRLEKTHAARLGIDVQDFPLRTLAVVGQLHDALWNMQGTRIAAIGSITSIATWKEKGGRPVPKLFSPNLKYCIDVKSWTEADD